jgi:hypothetical protein
MLNYITFFFNIRYKIINLDLINKKYYFEILGYSKLNFFDSLI